MPKGEGNSSSITRTSWPGAAKAGMRLAIRSRSSARRCRSRLCSVRKVVHEAHQPLDGRHLYGVVQAGPYAANRTVALQIVQPVSCGLMEKIIEQAGVLELKADIDSRAIRRDLRAAIEVMAVEALIEPATLLSSACRHDRQPVLANDPAQHQPGDIQRESRWCVEATLLHGLHLVAERR